MADPVCVHNSTKKKKCCWTRKQNVNVSKRSSQRSDRPFQRIKLLLKEKAARARVKNPVKVVKWNGWDRFLCRWMCLSLSLSWTPLGLRVRRLLGRYKSQKDLVPATAFKSITHAIKRPSSGNVFSYLTFHMEKKLMLEFVNSSKSKPIKRRQGKYCSLPTFQRRKKEKVKEDHVFLMGGRPCVTKTLWPTCTGTRSVTRESWHWCRVRVRK